MQKTSTKLNVLTKVLGYMNPDRSRLFMKALFSFQFPYCPSAWMFHSGELNDKINRLHERCLRVVYYDTNSLKNYEELLQKDNSVSIHYRNIQVLATEIFRVYRGYLQKL